MTNRLVKQQLRDPVSTNLRASRICIIGSAALTFLVILWINFLTYSSISSSKLSDKNSKSHCSTEPIELAIVVNSLNKKFRSLGGTGHWFHLLERLLPLMDEFNKFQTKVKTLDSDKRRPLNVIFDRRDDAEGLGSFGRLLLVSFITGGRAFQGTHHFDRVIFGHSSNKLGGEKQTGEVANFEERDFYPDFVVDLESSDYANMFDKSADDTVHLSKEPTPKCLQVLSHISLNRAVAKLEWFDSSYDRFETFRNSIYSTCDNTNKRVRLKSGGPTAAKMSIPLELVDRNVNYNESKNSSRVVVATTADEKENDIDHHYTHAVSIQEVVSTNASDISDDLNIGEGEMQRKILRSTWKNKEKNVPLKSSPLMRVSTQERLRVVIYQRDKSRVLLNAEHAVKKLGMLLGPRWVVETVLHSDLCPCKMIDLMRTATVLITPHGFQSVLLLFQPLSSVLIEVHPSHYLKQEVYGFVQAGLRQSFNIARSYLAEESVPVVPLAIAASYVMKWCGFLTHDCMHSAVCRNIARRQDVLMSEHFIQRSATFLSTHFVT